MAIAATETRYPNADAVGLKYLVSSAIGLILVVLVGSLMAFQVTGLGQDYSAYFLNLRGLHLQTIIFAWLSMAMMGAMLYTIPRTVGRDLFSKKAANLQFYLTWTGIILVAVTLMAGYSEGREYLEPILPIDLAVVIVWLLFAGNLFLTIATSGAKTVPFSTRFMFLSIVYLGVNYLIGMIPLQGMQDNLVTWTFAHNQVNGWFMFGLMGLMYYYLPILTKTEGKPPYNMALSHIHFWSVALFIPPSVLHHLLYRAIPVSEFWKEAGQWTSVGMLVPTIIWTYIVYRYLKTSKVGITLPLKFMSVAMVFYFMNCAQGAIQSIRSLNDIVHGTQWTVGHAHIALVGWISFGVMGVVLHLVPTLSNRKLFSEKLAGGLQLWSMIGGLVAMWIALSIGGMVQGSILSSGQGFYAARQALEPYFQIRLVGGLLYSAGAIFFAYNVFATIRQPISKEISNESITTPRAAA